MYNFDIKCFIFMYKLFHNDETHFIFYFSRAWLFVCNQNIVNFKEYAEELLFIYF